MNKELEAIKDAWSKDTGDGRDRDATVALCDAYVAANPDLYAGLDKFDLPTLVTLLSNRRDAGDDEGAWNVEAYLIHAYEPQQIGGEYKAQTRIPGQ